MRERLIEMIQTAVGGCTRHWAEVIADYLLANGVIVKPCKIGDKIYCDGKYFASHCTGEIMEFAINDIETTAKSMFRGEPDVQFDFEAFGKTVFLTREDAERALKGDEGK